MEKKSVFSRLGWSAYLASQMAGQSRVPFRPRAEIELLQRRRMRAMLEHAYRSVPHYRAAMDRLGLKPSDFRNVSELARLPLIEPEELREGGERFFSSSETRERCIPLRTGGSTGDPRLIYHTVTGIFQNAAHGERERCFTWGLLGRKFGYRETVIVSPNCTAEKLQRVMRQRALLPSRVRIRRQYLSLTDPTEKNVGAINQFKPDVIHSYGSYLQILFSFVAESRAEFCRPRVVTYSSDSLSESARRLIEDSFGVPVFGTYQANEALKIGFECDRHTGLHLNSDLYPLRIVDSSGRDLPPGQTGDVVVSNLVNRATVLLNYRLGDLAAILPHPCPCGRTFPLLSFPPGRSDDLIVLPTGRVMHPQAIRTVFTTEEDIWQFQVVQRSALDFDIRLVAARNADKEKVRERVATKFVDRFGAEVRTNIVFVDQIDRTAAGKFRPILSMHAGAHSNSNPAGGPDGQAHG